MANDIIKLETVRPNFQVLHGSYGAKSWFSYGTLIAHQVSADSNLVWVTPSKYSATTAKHLGIIKQMCETYGFKLAVTDSDDELNGWAA